jgi:hypothetical protein
LAHSSGVIDELSDDTPCLFNGSALSVSHPMFDFCKSLLDRIEIGRVGRQELELCAGHWPGERLRICGCPDCP